MIHRPFSAEDILTPHSRESTGGANNITPVSVPAINAAQSVIISELATPVLDFATTEPLKTLQSLFVLDCTIASYGDQAVPSMLLGSVTVNKVPPINTQHSVYFKQ